MLDVGFAPQIKTVLVGLGLRLRARVRARLLESRAELLQGGHLGDMGRYRAM